MSNSCIAFASDGKPSDLHTFLVEDVYGQDKSGLKKAEEKYHFIKSDFFKEDIGYNWENLTEEQTSDLIERKFLNAQGEPNIKIDTYGPYILRIDGSRAHLDFEPLSDFTESQIKELVDYTIVDSLNGMQGLKEIDFESESNFNLSETLSKGSDVYEYLKALGLTNVDVEELRKRVIEKLSNSQIKVNERLETISKIDDEATENSDPDAEKDEVRNSNDVVRKESFTKNSKDTASANVKLMLSFIPVFESYTENEDGTIDFELKEGDITPVLFNDMDKIWRKIEKELSGVFTKNVNGNIESVTDQMLDKLYELGKEDPSIMYVWNTVSNDNYSLYKKTQFAQAFLKQEIMFYTADAKGSPGSIRYTFYNSNTNTSKEYQIRSMWEFGAHTGKLYTRVDNDKKIYHTISKKELDITEDTVDKLLKASRRDVKAKVEVMSDAIRSALTDELTNLGIPISSIDNRTLDKVLRKVQQEVEPTKKFNELRALNILIGNYINPAIKILKTVKDKSLTSVDSGFINPLKSNALTKLFAETEATFRDDYTENTMMGADNKMVWGFSMPTYIDITLHKIKSGFVYDEETGLWSNSYIKKLRKLNSGKRSKWLEWMSIKENADSFVQQTFLSFQSQSNSGLNSVDNKNIKYIDQLADQVNKYINGVKDGEKSMFYTPTPSDKGRLISFMGPEMVQSNFMMGNGGGIALSPNSKSVTQMAGYFEDEYDRITTTFNTITNIEGDYKDSDQKLYVNMHIDNDGKIIDENGIPTGNGFKSQLFPELSPTYSEVNTPLEKQAAKVRKLLYSDESNKFEPVGLTADARKELNIYIAQALTESIRDNIKEFKKLEFVDENGMNKLFDSNTWDKYKENAISKVPSRLPIKEQNKYKDIQNNEILSKIIGDYTVNGVVANIEFSKIFSGDIGFYKNPVDYNKRIPATYTDGKYLANISNPKDLSFNIAVVESIELEAERLDKLEEAFVTSLKEKRKYMDYSAKKIYTDEYIKRLAKTYTKPFEKVNAADAQAWISLDRWKQLKTGLNGWSPKLEEAYQRMINGNFTAEDIKLSAQPLKGVFFDRNDSTGVPTYLKYSQAVLIPGMFKGTSLENLTKAMEKGEIDEVITLDGVKSGALSPTKIHNDDGSMVALDDMKFNTYKLSNLNWKLQQDLPTKGAKNNMDLGSQLQKNIISNIIFDKTYGEIDGVEITGQQIVELMHETITELTDNGFKKAIKSIGASEDGKITNPDKFYSELAKQLNDKNTPSFIVNMIKKQYSLDAIPQIRYKSQNVISSIINNNVAKTTTPGGSYIQVSSVGVTKEDLSIPLDSTKGIYMLKNVSKLSRPKINDNNKVSSGQVFMPHSMITKYIPNYRELTREQLNEKLDSRLLEIIGYRIPNQKMSSIQPLEIVGILPPSMGDSIMMYTEITTQTGSDFDIDKTYVMMPDFYFDKKRERLNYINSKGKKGEQNNGALRNQLFELYLMILKDPATYADMMSSIDGSALRNGIDNLHGKGDKLTGVSLSNPLYQLKIKFDNSVGKSGVGLTANQMVDHVYTQIHNSKLEGLDMGIGHTEGGSQLLNKTYDTDGGVITDSISMFLNAFVDIAKDPYITKGNFNSETSNAVFFMLRSGVPLDFIIKFIGQPSFKEVVELKLNSESLVGDGRTHTLNTAINEVISNYEKKLKGQKINPSDIEYGDKFKTLADLEQNRSLMAHQIMNVQQNEMKNRDILAQINMLKSFKNVVKMSDELTELVLASKADVNGGGHDIASHVVNASRYNKVMNESMITGVKERFAPNSMLGSKTRRTLEFLSNLDSELYMTANNSIKNVYSYFSVVKNGSQYITSQNFARDIEKSLYAHMMGQIFNKTGKYLTSEEEMKTMFKSDGNKKSIADRVERLKKQDDLKDNALIQSLEPKMVKGYKFVSLDNFKNKPSSSLDEINRAWDELLDNDKYKEFALDLVKYSFTTSGFTRNRHSIYDVIPERVSNEINRYINYSQDKIDMTYMLSDSLMQDFLKSVHNESWVTKRKLGKLNSINAVRQPNDVLKLLNSRSEHTSKLKINDIILLPLNQDLSEENADMLNALARNKIVNLFSYNDIGDMNSSYYSNQGVIIDIDNDQEYQILTRTNKKGFDNKGLKIYENGTNHNVSSIPGNVPVRMDIINDVIENVDDFLITSFEENAVNSLRPSSDSLKGVTIKPSEKSLDNLTRRNIMKKDENC